MDWTALEDVAPEIAELGRDRLDRARVALLATLRSDGWPRVSPIEPYFSQGLLLFGAMTWSLKALDLRRDPRCTLHSAVTGPDSGEGELKLYGRAAEVDEAVRSSCEGGWWLDKAPETATVFGLSIERAAFVGWDIGGAQMEVRSWSPEHGYTSTHRRYP